jgi:hypothetical protein
LAEDSEEAWEVDSVEDTESEEAWAVESVGDTESEEASAAVTEEDTATPACPLEGTTTVAAPNTE